MQKYICYTDGSYQDSIKSGGWSSIILNESEDLIKVLYQGYKNTTNNRMELKGVIETLKYINKPSEIIIYSDSQYIVNSVSKKLYLEWIRTLDKKNLDLWFELVDLLEQHVVTIKWVKGHNGNKWNELADKWCTFAAQCYNLKEDQWTTDLISKN